MQTSISMPSVLRAVATLKQWSASENELASIFMEESVSNLQVSAAITCASGCAMLFFYQLSFIFVLSGLALLGLGASILKED